MKLLIVVLVVSVCCVAALDGDAELSVERRCWKKFEEMVDIIGITPNPIPQIAEKMLKKRSGGFPLLLDSVIKLGTAAVGVASAAGGIKG